MDTLLTHIKRGFDIGYQGPHSDIRSHNLPSALDHPEVVDDYLVQECLQGRMAGPFAEAPFHPFHCSGIGVVPKQDGSWRVITHLSAPGGLSVNDFIDPESVTLSYTTIDTATNIAQLLGKGALLAKIDLKKAFRQCPVRQEDWHLLGIHWKSQYYYDKCLPFGLRSSPFLFDTLASALEYVAREQFQNKHIIHYLDDFLIAGPPQSPTCMNSFEGMEALCTHLGISTKSEKRTPPTTCITFLGIQLDTSTQVMSIPPEKLEAILLELRAFSSRQKFTKRALLSVIGKLAFAAKAIPAGRIFLRRLIDASMKVKALHHHIRVSAAMRADLDWWHTFASNWNGKSFFLEPGWTPSPAYQQFTDASQAGFGCYWKGHWLCSPWPRQLRPRDIQWKELYAVVVAARAWGAQWSKKRLLIHCDNQAVVAVWQAGTTKNAPLMQLVRTLFLIAASHNFTVILQHIEGANNCIADALSRLQHHRFRELVPGADTEPTPIPAVQISA